MGISTPVEICLVFTWLNRPNLGQVVAGQIKFSQLSVQFLLGLQSSYPVFTPHSKTPLIQFRGFWQGLLIFYKSVLLMGLELKLLKA